MMERPLRHRILAAACDRSTRRAIHPLLRSATLCTAMLCAGCEPAGEPPPSLFFSGLPISGGLADAQRAGFNTCFNTDAVHMLCRQHGVMLEDHGPYEASVGLEGSDGRGGFDQVTLWHDRDNNAVHKIADTLKHQGWNECFTGDDRAGDLAIYTLKGSPVRISMDLSYWGKRRLRIIPEWNQRERRCIQTRGAASS